MKMLPTYTQLTSKDVAEGVSRASTFIDLLKIK
jgi:hypothetical protein